MEPAGRGRYQQPGLAEAALRPRHVVGFRDQRDPVDPFRRRISAE